MYIIKDALFEGLERYLYIRPLCKICRKRVRNHCKKIISSLTLFKADKINESRLRSTPLTCSLIKLISSISVFMDFEIEFLPNIKVPEILGSNPRKGFSISLQRKAGEHCQRFTQEIPSSGSKAVIK